MLRKEILAFSPPLVVSNMEELFLDLNNKENETLGIKLSVVDKSTLDCAKFYKKRGRKSLLELRANDGSAEGQVKLTDMFQAGKGKVLPKAP